MDVELLRAKYLTLADDLSERARRLWAATEAMAIGYGGISLVVRATGVNESTVLRGIKEVESGETIEPGRIRRPGGGRKKIVATDTTLVADLESLVEPTASGDPQSRLRWTSKSLRNLADELQAMGHEISYRSVAKVLGEAGYTLQSNRRSQEPRSHPDRDEQFRFINREVIRLQRVGQPVISVDTKKKELVGDFKSAGREWRPKGKPQVVRVHDFMIPEKGKAIPYGVYDLTRNAGWVSVGIDHDTASFAVRTIRRWWQTMGKPAYPRAESLLITADSGGSNGARVRLWKFELQQFADRSGLSIHVRHLPPGTSKWNKIEHRLFSYISTNWRGRPLTSLATIVNLIASTKTRTGLRVRCEIDKGEYPQGRVITDKEMAAIRLEPSRFHGDWNYTIRPR